MQHFSQLDTVDSVQKDIDNSQVRLQLLNRAHGFLGRAGFTTDRQIFLARNHLHQAVTYDGMIINENNTPLPDGCCLRC